ncbi:uncharacterized protein LOC111322652 isoform X3 [Stylophora pistillata]|uniref:uncharacterized protein LOC111322652 isoform X3 n=1 Tax=Stylophora pistillata TaxID=50429 RepID=UPI000C03EBBB|nr:uncharacterized protein LOC111322652 isoform X3 [Stylophora pistillata]
MSSYEDTSDSSYGSVSGELSAVPCGRCKVFVRNYKVDVKGGGTVAVGPNALINGVPVNQTTEDENSSFTQNREIDRGISYYVRHNEEEYSPRIYYQQTNVGDWTPKPMNGILIQKGENDFQWSVEFFLENPEKFVREMDTCAGSQKEEKELFILRVILPYLERELWGKSGDNNIEVYRVLAYLSSSRGCGDVAKHSLQQLQHLLYRDCIQSAKQNLLSVEKILRVTIVSPDGAFKEEADSIRLLRLTAYGCILSELIIHQNQAGFSKIDSENNLKQLREIKNYFSKISLKKKDILRYSFEFIQEAISYLTQPPNKTLGSDLGNYLEECKRYCANSGTSNKELSLLKKLKKSEVKWCELHCLLHYLHGKVHTERPEQINKERRTMNLLTLVLTSHLDGGGGSDWKFCLLAGSILSEIAMKNAIKALRFQASLCLVYLRKDEKAGKRQECRAIIDRFSRRILFSPDRSIKRFLVPHLFDNQSEQYTLPTELHNQHLVSCYKTHTLEIDNMVTTEPNCEISSCFVSHGVLKRQEVAVKVLAVSKKDLVEEESSTESKAKKRLRAEAYNLWQLSSLRKHPNIPCLLAYNTVAFPHHIITAYEKYGNLLQLVRGSRECRPLSSVTLYKIIIGVTEALLYLHQELNLVHRAVMAENILVGDGYVPKLSGMHSVALLQHAINKDGERSSGYEYARDYDGLKEFIGEDGETLPVRCKAPETVSRNCYSIPSDVWAYAVFVYETLTLGCRPFRHIQRDEDVADYVLQKTDEEILPQESCIEDDEYNLMKRCWKRKRDERIGLFELKEQFLNMRSKIASSGEERPRPDAPSLEMSIESETQKSQRSIGSVLYEVIQDYSDVQSTSGTIYEEQNDYAEDTYEPQGYGTPETLVDLPTNYQQDAMKEKIPVGDKQHLRRLLCLSNSFLLPISRIDHLDSRSPVVDIISPRSPLGNLKEFILSRRCPLENIVTFLCQVATALHYLHVNHIVHGDLRPEHVYVVAPDQVQLGRLGRSKSLTMSAYEATSTSCVVEAVMPPDSTRWSAPEVIQDSLFSHASDVWAFGILAWELYTAFAAGQQNRIAALPYGNIPADKILDHMKENGPLDQPSGCPYWVYILMHQCWTYEPVERPPFIAIIDCLSRREPMLSWVMQLWLNTHEKSEWPVLSVSQPEDAIHVTNAEEHPSREDIEKMCSQGFFNPHKYLYVDSVRQNETDTAEVYDYAYTDSQLPPPPGSPAFHQSTPSNLSDGGLNVAGQYKTNQPHSATEMVFEEPSHWIITNDEGKTDSAKSNDSFTSHLEKSHSVANEDQCLQNHKDSVAGVYSLYGDSNYKIFVDEHSSDQATGGARGHSTCDESAKDYSEEEQILHAGYKDFALTREYCIPMRNNQEKPETPGYINVPAKTIAKTPGYINVPAKTVAQHSQSAHSNEGTVVDSYTCVDLLGPVFWQRSTDIVTTESFSCNEHDLEHQPSLELHEDIAIQLLLKDADILYLREVQRRKYEEKLQESWYQDQSSPLQQVLFQEHLDVHANVSTNLDVGLRSSMYAAMKSIGSRLVGCDTETTL